MACRGDGDSRQSMNGGSKQRKGMSTPKPAVQKEGQYADPVYKKLSRLNGEVNKLTKAELQIKLHELGLDTRGVKEVLKKRMKNYYRRKKLAKAHLNLPELKKYDYIAVIDFEATCEEDTQDYEHEIIEFPIVLIDMDKMEIVDKFQEYVKPVINPRLTPFCTKLTGIKQAMVDKADTFPVVLERVIEWFTKHELGVRYSFAVLTDGPWDMYRFMYQQCEISQVTMPKWAKRWINVRKTYSNFYQCPKGGIETMLKNLGMRFEGSPHCGLDDATNIARIAVNMIEDGCVLRINEYLDIQFDEETKKTSVRFEAFREEKTDDGKKCNKQNENDTNGSHQKKSGSASVVDDLKIGQLCLQSTFEQQEEDVEDLISYYRSQKR